MPGILTSFDPRHTWQFLDDFEGVGTLAAAAADSRWTITDTSSAGTPTYVRVDVGETTGDFVFGSVKLTLANNNEAENVCLSWGDKLAFDIDRLRGFECRVRMSQATMDANTMFAIGVSGDRNDAIDTMAVGAIFRVVGADSTTALVVETDDTSNNNDDVATGTTLINAWKRLAIDFSSVADVKFYVDDAQVAAATTFDMSAYSAGLQPFVQLQKASGTGTDAVEIDYIRVWGVR